MCNENLLSYRVHMRRPKDRRGKSSVTHPSVLKADGTDELTVLRPSLRTDRLLSTRPSVKDGRARYHSSSIKDKREDYYVSAEWKNEPSPAKPNRCEIRTSTSVTEVNFRACWIPQL